MAGMKAGRKWCLSSPRYRFCCGCRTICTASFLFCTLYRMKQGFPRMDSGFMSRTGNGASRLVQRLDIVMVTSSRLNLQVINFHWHYHRQKIKLAFSIWNRALSSTRLEYKCLHLDDFVFSHVWLSHTFEVHQQEQQKKTVSELHHTVCGLLERTGTVWCPCSTYLGRHEVDTVKP